MKDNMCEMISDGSGTSLGDCEAIRMGGIDFGRASSALL